MTVSILPGMGRGDYRVELDGQQIGHVRKRVERYNLRRVITSTNWDAFDLPIEDDKGRRQPPVCILRGAERRRDAVAALVDHYQRSLS